jgi:hypothetical protein
MIHFDDLSMWVQACGQQVALFRKVMPMVMDNLTIVQHWDIFQYARTKGLCLPTTNNIHHIGCDYKHVILRV